MTAPTILVIGHGARLPLGRLQSAARSHGLALQVARPALGEPLPATAESDHTGVVVLGGPQSAYNVARHPCLAEEIAFLA